jgi:nicotinate dehydrogenase subunit B
MTMRRRTLLEGAIVVGFAWRALAHATADVASAPKPLPGSLKVQPTIDGWIRVDADGRITVFSGKAELGQGIRTALLQVAAEELLVEPSRITLVTADTERTANEGYTAGSHSMQDSGTAIRHAAAQVRALLMTRAAEHFAVAPETLTAANARVRCGNASVGYGELVSGDVLHVEAAPQVVLRDPKTHTQVGKPMPRVDIPAKLTGGAAYLQDMRPPGMVHGRIVRPPSPNATLRSVDSMRIEAMPGVLKVVRDGHFIGVIAQREFQAVTAARALAQATQWDVSPTTLPEPAQLYRSLRSARAEDHVIHDVGDTDSAGAGTNGKTLEAVYERPYQLHGSIGPSCSIAQLVDGKYTVWTHTQGVFPLRKALAELLVHAGGEGALHPHRRRRLLRSQRRRRRVGRCRAAGARAAGAGGARAMDARG